MYKLLIDKIKGRYKKENQDQKKTSETSTILAEERIVSPERSNVSISQKIIRLVNDCLSSTYPMEFGNVIKKLKSDDIQVFKDEGYSRFLRERALMGNHSLRTELVKKLAEDFAEAVYEPDFGNLLVTIDDQIDKPIFLAESIITGIIDFSNGRVNYDERLAALDTSLVIELIHENFHRSTGFLITPENAIPIKPTDPLFSLAFSTERDLESSQKDKRIRKALVEIRKQLTEYASYHEPLILTEGARIYLFAKDKDGIHRVITVSGYDLNEAVVEFLTKNTVPILVRSLYASYPQNVAKKIESIVTGPQASFAGSYRHRRLTSRELSPTVLSLMKDLGLRDLPSFIHAYVDGEVPRIYAKRFPNREYFT